MICESGLLGSYYECEFAWRSHLAAPLGEVGPAGSPGARPLADLPKVPPMPPAYPPTEAPGLKPLLVPPIPPPAESAAAIRRLVESPSCPLIIADHSISILCLGGPSLTKCLGEGIARKNFFCI